LEDPSCLGIDFGKGSRSGECFFNTDEVSSYSSASEFDAWRKANTCACVDTPNWSDGTNGCAQYEENSPDGASTGWCDAYGGTAFNDQGTANDNCCVCGGGNIVELCRVELWGGPIDDPLYQASINANIEADTTYLVADYNNEIGAIDPVSTARISGSCAIRMMDTDGNEVCVLIAGQYDGPTFDAACGNDVVVSYMMAPCVDVNHINDNPGFYTCSCVDPADNCLSDGGCVAESACPASNGQPIDCEVMAEYCVDCDIEGAEVLRGSDYTLTQCQDECLEDPSCLGIDFGKGSRSGECFFNTDEVSSYSSASEFDAWRKANTCACVDTPNWSDGTNGCAQYEENSPDGASTGWCDAYGGTAFNDQGTANDNCCVCGGGNIVELCRVELWGGPIDDPLYQASINANIEADTTYLVADYNNEIGAIDPVSTARISGSCAIRMMDTDGNEVCVLIAGQYDGPTFDAACGNDVVVSYMMAPCVDVNHINDNPGFYTCSCVDPDDDCLSNGECVAESACPASNGQPIVDEPSTTTYIDLDGDFRCTGFEFSATTSLYSGNPGSADECRAKCDENDNCNYYAAWDSGHCETYYACPSTETDGTLAIHRFARCPNVSKDGKCGPLHNDKTCSTHYRKNALYCNEDSGRCGNTAAHRDAQTSTKYDDSQLVGACRPRTECASMLDPSKPSYWTDDECNDLCNNRHSCHERCPWKCRSCACNPTCVSKGRGWKNKRCNRFCNKRWRSIGDEQICDGRCDLYCQGCACN